jgi:hypothetical protein
MFLVKIRQVIQVAVHILNPAVSESEPVHLFDHLFIFSFINRPVKPGMAPWL